MGWLLVLGLKVECATLCIKSEVILKYSHVLSSTYGQFDIFHKSLHRHYKLFPHIPNIGHLSCMFELLIGMKKVKYTYAWTIKKSMNKEQILAPVSKKYFETFCGVIVWCKVTGR